MKNILADDSQFRQLGPGETLTTEQLREVSGLIYATDEYIYPAMFAHREDAFLMIPEMFRMGDRMFCPENLFLALRGERAVALVLWKKGPMHWTPKIYQKAAEMHGIVPSCHLERVQREYFAAYQETLADTVAVINVCVSEEIRGTGIGRRLLDAFLKETEGGCSQYELFVLADNLPAFKLYTAAGFEIEEALQGFSVEPKEVLCYRMLR